jgi:mRNA interferase RelE/StbE
MSKPGVTRWQVVIAREPKKVLARLPRDLLKRVQKAIDALAVNPRHPGCVSLTGYELWRVRVGGWRILYAIEDDRLIVLVVEIAPRGGAYRDL